MNERIDAVRKIREIAGDYLDYVLGYGNECAYTDSMLKEIQKLIEEVNK